MVEDVTLYFCEGSSDKIYRAYVIERGGGYMVGFTYGRRGGHMTEGFKNSVPLSLEDALLEFSKLVTSKERKGYRRV